MPAKTQEKSQESSQKKSPKISQMLYRPLGKCGTKVSLFGLGGWTTFGGTVQEQGVIDAIVRAAYDHGINFFDLADIYANGRCEEAMGKPLRALPRHEIVVSSKVFWPMSEDVNDRGLSRKHIMESVERSLRRLGLAYLDLYFCHRWDPETPCEETVRAMSDLVQQGKILYWGTSEWSADQIDLAWRCADIRNLYAPQVEQPQYSLLARRKFEGSIRDKAEERGMGLVAWSPLASGVLTGKYDDGVPADSRLSHMDWLREKMLTPDHLERVRKMKAIADRLECTRAQLGLAWAAAQPGVSSVITGATRLSQLEENLGALSVSLDKQALHELDELFPRSASTD
jgi:voltage-dependent potassium channel beta subunit